MAQPDKDIEGAKQSSTNAAEALFKRAFSTTGLKRRGTGKRTRPDRHVDLPPLLGNKEVVSEQQRKCPSGWVLFSWATTCCFPGFCLSACNIKGKGPQQAWREKVALCWIVLVMSGLVLFFAVFFNDLLCPASALSNAIPANVEGGVIIRGIMYNARNATKPYNTLFQFPRSFGGYDVTTQFNQPSLSQCNSINHPIAQLRWPCETDNPSSCLDLNQLNTSTGGIYGLRPFNTLLDEKTRVDPNAAYEWDDINRRQYTVFNRTVLNLNIYVNQVKPIPNDPIDALIRLAQQERDATLLLNRNSNYSDVLACVTQKYYAGVVSQLSFECIFARLIIGITTALVIGVLLVRIMMAMFFSWFLAGKMAKTPDIEKLKAQGGPSFRRREKSIVNALQVTDAQGAVSPHNALDNYDLYTVFLVTCYSEGENSLRTTIGSLSATEYNDRKKLLFIVADGIVTGKGNAKSTPELILDMIQLDPAFGDNPKPYSYVAVASGSKQHNMAKVYCGYFMFADRAVPTVVVVKCGTPEEATQSKPGNRGKRDSQLILMNFFSRVTLNDRMTPLDFDLFRKIHHIAGVTPDHYEVVLMVDADTQVKNNSLRLMINCFLNDPMIVGLCGETRIANKTQNFTTKIQIFEYYISHYLGKAFESVFGGVTCLPGCFCMYRIKARKGENWIPLLVNPDITHTYSTNDVYTLHQKNLFLLGEDRFLSTMMLRTFPNRKLVFVPNAVCKTVVPDDFKTLLSQRRRWINSTVHNLMELVLVNELCGTFCFSMQFVVFMDLIGTAALPASLAVTYYLIYRAFVASYSDPATWLPTAMLLAVIFLPGLAIIFTNFKFSRVGWMLLYLLVLPVWQFILPLYAFWRFDDFSWGATRKVAGVKEAGHGPAEEEDEFDPTSVPFRRWEEYERAWRKSQWKKQQKMASMAAAQFYGVPMEGSPVYYAPMDTQSIASGVNGHEYNHARQRMSMMSASSVDSGSILPYRPSSADFSSDVTPMETVQQPQQQ